MNKSITCVTGNWIVIGLTLCFFVKQILLLNGTYDRETRGMMASHYVWAITNSLNRTFAEDSANRLENVVGIFSRLFVFFVCLQGMWIFVHIIVASLLHIFASQIDWLVHDLNMFYSTTQQPSSYVTILFAPKDGEIPVDVECLHDMQIQTIVSIFT